MRRRSPLRSALLAAAALILTPAAAQAATADAWGDDIEVIADDDMAELNGGFDIPQIGITVRLGVSVTTLMNGTPVLNTNITWTDAGKLVEQTMADVGQSLSDLSPEARTALGLDGLEGAGGVVINDASGVTALVHNVTESTLQNIIVNTATGRDISQEIDVTLELPGFDAIQGSLTAELFGIRVMGDLNQFTD